MLRAAGQTWRFNAPWRCFSIHPYSPCVNDRIWHTFFDGADGRFREERTLRCANSRILHEWLARSGCSGTPHAGDLRDAGPGQRRSVRRVEGQGNDRKRRGRNLRTLCRCRPWNSRHHELWLNTAAVLLCREKSKGGDRRGYSVGIVLGIIIWQYCRPRHCRSLALLPVSLLSSRASSHSRLAERSVLLSLR